MHNTDIRCVQFIHIITTITTITAIIMIITYSMIYGFWDTAQLAFD